MKIVFITLIFSASHSIFSESDWQKATELRKNQEILKAEKLLKPYSSPAKFDQLKAAEKIDFLRGLLELAHVKALKDDVPGSLALLNWAEGRTDEYQRSIACVKYAEILLDLGEFERAQGYLKNADEIIAKRVTGEDTGTAIGQGGETADTGAVWRGLRDQADALKADIEAEAMKKKFGATYGNYVKLRRLQNLLKRSKTPRYLKEAMKVADEIIETDPASQFAAAAGYLKGEILASRLKETSPKKEISEVKEYLNKFVKQQPDGLYRGEALMLLGKISLEIEWNAKDAEKYYSQALDWFRKSREKRDAVSLYAAMNDDLKKQSAPTQKPTTLNQWKRIVYHDEDPLRLYNTANAPVWYIDDKEKNCIFILGFLAFSEGKYDTAKSYWEKILSLSPDIAAVNQRLPNIQTRLLKACRLKAMVFWPEEKAYIKNNDAFRLLYAEYLTLIEKIDEAILRFQEIMKSSDVIIKAIATMGMVSALDIEFKSQDEKLKQIYCLKILNNIKFKKHAIYPKALSWLAIYKSGGNNNDNQEVIKLFDQYIQQFPQGRDINRMKYYLALIYLQKGMIHEAKCLYIELKQKNKFYSTLLNEKINSFQKKKG